MTGSSCADCIMLEWTSALFILKKINEILDKHALFKYISRKQQKNISKPWITNGILKSIKIKITLYNKFCQAKNNKLKFDLHSKFKKYRNLILTLSRKSKDFYLKSFFEEHKKTWSVNMTRIK